MRLLLGSNSLSLPVLHQVSLYLRT